MLREQVITPRGGRTRAPRGRGAGDVVQRPARRNTDASKRRGAGGSSRVRALRRAVAWLPRLALVTFAVCAGLLCFAAYRAAAASDLFALRTVDVGGVSRASEEQLKGVVRRAAATTGVWKADLEAIRAELERQPWVRRATVTRVLPSGLRVRVVERVPRAVVRTGEGRLVWVDDDAVVVGAFSAASEQMPAFFLRGLDESGGDAARAENRRRVAKYLELLHEWEAAKLAPRVSELNLDDLRDVRAQLAGDDARVEVRLGRENFTHRLSQALQTLDESRGGGAAEHITYVDMTPGKRAVIGFDSAWSKTQAARQGEESLRAGALLPAPGKPREEAESAATVGTRGASARRAAAPTARSAESPKAGRTRGQAKADGGGARASASNQGRGAETRPRRVGRGE